VVIDELLIARNPDPASSLTYLLRVPLGKGSCSALQGLGRAPRPHYCYPVSSSEWHADADIIKRVALRSCVRRGAAIDLVVDRARENRSELVYTTARGRDAVFWQSPPVQLDGPAVTGPSPTDMRAWARINGIAVPERGRLPAEVRDAWLAAHLT
jgi:hypothetical protein